MDGCQVVAHQTNGMVTEYQDLASAANAIGSDACSVGGMCRGTYNSPYYDAEFIPDVDLVYVHAKISSTGKLELTTEVERWVEIDPNDWVEGGKYFCVRAKKAERSNVSDHVRGKRAKLN